MSEKRDYLKEAKRIIQGRTMMLPQKEHLIALITRLEEEGVYFCEHDGEVKNGICLECGEEI